MTGEKKQSRFWKGFWLSFLVVSLAYAWYSFYAPSNRIAWADNFAAAQQQAAASDKPMILFFTGPWCSPCQIMKREVWADDEVMNAVNTAYVSVTLDVKSPHAADAVERFSVGATPTTIVTDSQGNVLEHVRGGMSKAEFLGMLGELGSARVERL